MNASSNLTIKNHVLVSCNKNATSEIIPNGIIRIENHAFENCKSLTTIKLPDSLKEIGERAFCNCKSLTSIIIPDSVIEIGVCAFAYCDLLSSIVISNNVIKLDSFAFQACPITNFVIPKTINSMGTGIFCDCNSLKSIKYHGSIKQFEKINGINSFLYGSPLSKVVLLNEQEQTVYEWHDSEHPDVTCW